MRVDPRLEQFQALIERQRLRQPAITPNPVQPAARTSYTDAASRARQAMAAKNPALAARLRQAERMSTALTRITPEKEIVTGTSRPARPATPPVIGDLPAMPATRTSKQAGLGQHIDTYA